MPGVHLIALVLAVVTISVLVELLRRRQLRQKYALTWIVVGVVVAVVAIFPGTYDRIARDMGVANPADLLVVLAALFLLLVCVHLSWEIGRLEDRNRRLAEELTLLRNDVGRLAERQGTTSAATDLPQPAEGSNQTADSEVPLPIPVEPGDARDAGASDTAAVPNRVRRGSGRNA